MTKGRLNLHSEANSVISHRHLIFLLLGVTAITLSRFHGYLLFHGFVEIFSVAIAWIIFSIVWNARKMVDSGYFMVMGVAFLHTGFIDFIHTLAYKGMGVFPAYGANLPTELWIAARFLESASLLVAIVLKDKTISNRHLFAFYSTTTAIMIWSIFTGPFPDCYIEGEGLTVFKVYSEYAIIFLLAVSIYLYSRDKSHFAEEFRRILMGALIFTIGSELSFTLYTDVYGISNMLGHIFKFISFYLFYLAVVRGSLVNPFSTLFRELKLTQLRASKKAAALQRVNKELEAFVGMVSHDLRSPLQVLNMSVEVMREECKDSEFTCRHLDTMRNSIENLSDLLSDLLRLASISKGELDRAPFNLSKLIREEADLVQEGWKDISVEVEVQENMIVNADKGLVRILIHNLLSNAFKYSQNTDNPVIRAGVSRDNDNSVYYIKDNGIGFERERLGDVFDPFVTAHNGNYSGSGIGLSIAQKIIEAHSGDIWAESKPGQGATFYFVLNPEDLPNR
ncbi:MAG: MASE3 domain-containing protein [Candidatus Thorarchaeota archaeon]